MSFSTLRQGCVLPLLLIVSLFPSALARAGELEDIEGEHERAEMEYIKKASMSSDKSPAHLQELFNEIMAPSQKRMKEFADKRANPYPQRSMTPSELKQLNAAGPVPFANPSGGPLPSQKDDSKGKRPEYVLDGSKVPKEISFSPPARFKAPSVAPSSAPSLVPALH